MIELLFSGNWLDSAKSTRPRLKAAGRVLDQALRIKNSVFQMNGATVVGQLVWLNSDQCLAVIITQ